MDISQLEQLARIAETSSISEAAKDLHVSQSALSRSMKRLEQELGVTLFTRGGNTAKLNDLGRAAVEYARAIVTQSKAMGNVLTTLQRNQMAISIGSCAPTPLAACATRIHERMSNQPVYEELVSIDDAENGLAKGTYHIAILPYRIADGSASAFRIFSEHLYIRLHESHKLASRTEGIFLRELDGETIPLFTQIGFWSDLCMAHMPGAQYIAIDNHAVLRELAENSTLPSFVTDRAIEQFGGCRHDGRVDIPILDKAANPTFWGNVLNENRQRFAFLFRS